MNLAVGFFLVFAVKLMAIQLTSSYTGFYSKCDDEAFRQRWLIKIKGREDEWGYLNMQIMGKNRLTACIYDKRQHLIMQGNHNKQSYICGVRATKQSHSI